MGIGIILAAVAVAGLLLVVAHLLLQKPGSVPRDETPTSLASRGSYIPWVLGQRRREPVFCWAGLRFTRKEDIPGAKKPLFGDKPKQRIYYESGWHVISVGPACTLYAILENGKVLFRGPISSSTTPSGTKFYCEKGQAFRIYWGEGDQPIDDFLSPADRVGISSRWPFLFHIVWLKKRLGSQPIWQNLHYVFETRPTRSGLHSTPGWIDDSHTTLGSAYAISSATDGGPGDALIKISGRYTDEFPTGGHLFLTGNSAPEGDYTVWSSSEVDEDPGEEHDWKTYIYLANTLSGSDNNGTVAPYLSSQDDGVNAAHGIDQMLFATWPHGLNLDRELFDLDSLEALGELMAEERLPLSLLAKDGETANRLLNAVMQDTGFLVPIDQGKVRFLPVRDPTGTDVPTIPAKLLDQRLPEIKQVLTPVSSETATKVVFSFMDRARRFRSMTIALDDAGNADFVGHQRARSSEIPTVVDFATATIVANRRSQEELLGAVAFKFEGMRQTRLLTPGQAFIVEGVPAAGEETVLRCVSITPSVYKGKVNVEAIADFYGAPASAFIGTSGGGYPPEDKPRMEDLAYNMVEVPGVLLPFDLQVIVPRLRAHDQVRYADHFVSDGSDPYLHVLETYGIHRGGFLDAEFSSSTDMNLDQGPTINVENTDDIGDVLDLSSDLFKWRAGKQVALIVSNAGVEFCFLKKLTAVAGNQYRLDGLLRARWGSYRLTHPASSPVFIFNRLEMDAFGQEEYIVPGETVYYKSVPQGYAEEEITAKSLALVGGGLIPLIPLNLRTDNVLGRRNAYQTGQDIVFSWRHRTRLQQNSGAGMQEAGTPTSVGDLEGSFRLQFLTTGDDLKREEVVQVNNPANLTYTYTNANLVSDFGVEPSSFKARVSNFEGNKESAYIEITITKF